MKCECDFCEHHKCYKEDDFFIEICDKKHYEQSAKSIDTINYILICNNIVNCPDYKSKEKMQVKSVEEIKEQIRFFNNKLYEIDVDLEKSCDIKKEFTLSIAKMGKLGAKMALEWVLNK